MAERKFRKLTPKPGSAAQARESIAQTIRQSSLMIRPNITDPIDYEDFVQQNKILLQNDPHRELLVIPSDDVTLKRIQRKQRTTKPLTYVFSINPNLLGEEPATPLTRRVSTASHQSSPSRYSSSTDHPHQTPRTRGSTAESSVGEVVSSNQTTGGSISNSYIKECLESFTKDWTSIEYKYESYSGNWVELPKLPRVTEKLQDQVYEIDDDNETNAIIDGLSGLSLLTKEGYILKGSEAGTDSFLSVATKSFKKRWMVLRQELDGSCSIEFYKDSKKTESKGSICLDLCSQIVRNVKRKFHSFELRMIEGHKPCILAAETESDLESWMEALHKACNRSETSSRKSLALTDPDTPTNGSSTAINIMSQSFKLSDLSRLPDLSSYSRETDSSISSLRKESRVNLFAVYPDLLSRKGNFYTLRYQPNLEPFRAIFGTRFMFTFSRLDFNLKTTIDGIVTHAEPFFASCSVFHTKLGKVTEEFRFDVNDHLTRDMLNLSYKLTTEDVSDERDFPKCWVTNPTSAIFSLLTPSPEMFLVIRVEKVLSGSISSASEPYIKSSEPHGKTGLKVHKSAKATCQRIGGYRMPFAWAARPLFKDSTKSLDVDSDFTPFYKQDSHKTSDEEIVKHLNELRCLEKPKNVTIIPGKLIAHVRQVGPDELVENCVTCNYLPVEPFLTQPKVPATIEVAEFLSANPRDTNPLTEFVNVLFVYPKFLKYDSQKMFSARNIAVTVEYKESDEETSIPLSNIFTRPCSNNSEDFSSSATSNVLHHNTCPDFYDEFKILLPFTLTEKSHLLFTFKHVSCSNKKNRKEGTPIDSPVGYSWMQLCPERGRMAIAHEVTLPVSCHLPHGYLSWARLGLGKGYSGPDIKWLDSGKEIFRVGFKLMSSLFPLDVPLHTFLFYSGKMLDFGQSKTDDDVASLLNRSISEISDPEKGFSRFVKAQHGMPKILKSLMEAEVASVVRFFPVLMTQLLRLIVSCTSEDVQQNCLRQVINILHHLKEVRKDDVSLTYVEYYFNSELVQIPGSKVTLHEELVRSLANLLRFVKDDYPLIKNLIENCGFFFQLLIKSMSSYLLSSGRIKMLRNERFSKEYQDQLGSFVDQVIGLIVERNKELSQECKSANQKVAYFFNRSFGLMDRGFVFRMIKSYLDKLHDAKDSVSLQLYKFEFLAIITSYEHHIPINLPLGPRTPQSSPKKAVISSPSKDSSIKIHEEDEGLGESELEESLKNSSPTQSTSPVMTSKVAEVEDDICLSENFLRSHYTVGVLLQETKSALSEVHQVRGMALTVLRNLLVKHSMDDRYQSRSQQSRIASLYFPFIPVILENVNRIQIAQLGTSMSSIMSSGLNTLSSGNKRVSFLDGSTSNPSPTNTLDSQTGSILKQHIRKNSVELNGHKRNDSSYLQMIAGTNPLSSNGQMDCLDVGHPPTMTHLNSSDPDIASKSPSPDLIDALLPPSSDRAVSLHTRSMSLPVRFDKLNASEGRDILVIFNWIIKHFPESSLSKYLIRSPDQTIVNFLTFHEMSLYEFRYQGRRDTRSKTSLGQSMTLPARAFEPGLTGDRSSQVFHSLLEANLATEVGLIALDVVGLIMRDLKDRVTENFGDNPIMKKIFTIYITFLRLGQSENLLKHLFASIRWFVTNFSDVLFGGSPSFVGDACFELLKSCSSKISSIRSESAALLYLLMRANFSYNNQQSMTRVHLQVIISVSKLLGDANIVLLNNSRFQESLAVINNFSSTDKTVKDSKFPSEVKELTKKIRTVLLATAAMREHENDPEMMMDLQHSLANSYAETSPALRRTWLESMAKNHQKDGNLSEAAECSAHIAALEAEIIRKRLDDERPCPKPSDFALISPNIPRDESKAGSKSCDGSHGNDETFTEDGLLETLESTATLFTKAERYEMVPEVYKIMIPIHERQRNFEALSKIYKNVSMTYDKVISVRKTGKRILGRYYRVAFYGKEYFDEESGKEFVYKEPKVTSLSEISDRLKDVFGKKFGHENIKLIMSEKEVDEKVDCDPKFAYIQVTHVHPYNHLVDGNNRLTEFEKMDSNLDRFMFETPFSLSDPSRARSAFPNDQCKRRTILTTSYQFPYVVKRIPVTSKSVSILSPIEVAIDEMEARVKELEEVVSSPDKPDLKKLQLKLQGSVSVTVNAGPLAYARAFLTPNATDSHGHVFAANRVTHLKAVFVDFINVCEVALEWNERLISFDQLEYQASLKNNFHEMVLELSQWIKEKGPGVSDTTSQVADSVVDNASLSSHESNSTNHSANHQPASILNQNGGSSSSSTSTNSSTNNFKQFTSSNGCLQEDSSKE